MMVPPENEWFERKKERAFSLFLFRESYTLYGEGGVSGLISSK
jgi:hypothetical protein